MQPKRILIAGAAGAVGFELLKQARAAGYWVRAHTRTTAHYAKLAAQANDVVIGDATSALSIEGLTREVDIVVSCMGAPVTVAHPEKRSYRDIDYVANRNLLEQARTNGVGRFVYLSAHLAPGYADTAYMRAHEAFVDQLQMSGLRYSVVRPTGIFYVFVDLLAYAKLGMCPVIGDGMARTNPIHEADVAYVLLENLEEGAPSVPCGGPEIFKRRDIAELMFKVIGKKPRIVRMPPGVFRLMGRLAGVTSARKRELFEFAGAVSVSSSIAPLIGRERLEDYLAGHVLKL